MVVLHLMALEPVTAVRYVIKAYNYLKVWAENWAQTAGYLKIEPNAQES